MDTRYLSSLRRLAVVMLLGAGPAGCAVYGPPYAVDSAYPGYGYPAYGYPTYVGPPVTLDLGFGFYRGHHHQGHHGWRSHGGHAHGWSHHRGRGRGWGHGRH